MVRCSCEHKNFLFFFLSSIFPECGFLETPLEKFFFLINNSSHQISIPLWLQQFFFINICSLCHTCTQIHTYRFKRLHFGVMAIAAPPPTRPHFTLHRNRCWKGEKKELGTRRIKHSHTFQRLCSWGIWWATKAVNNYLRCSRAVALPMDSLSSLPPSLVPTSSLSSSCFLSLSLSPTPSNASLFAFLSFFAVYKRFLSLASVCN